MEQSPDSAGEAFTGKLHDLLTEESDNETAQYSFQEEMVEEVMQEFYKEIIAFPVPPNPSPSLSPSLPANTSPVSAVFIDDCVNGSCGASVSDSTSTVMAGIDVLSFAGGFSVTGNESPVVELEHGSDASVGFGVGEEKKMEGFEIDGGDLDDEWLGRVLSWGQQNQVQMVETTQWF